MIIRKIDENKYQIKIGSITAIGRDRQDAKKAAWEAFLNQFWDRDDKFDESAAWEAMREWRNKLLAQSDWTQLPDAPLTIDERDRAKRYRQKLRDLPQIYTSLIELIWPDYM